MIDVFEASSIAAQTETETELEFTKEINEKIFCTPWSPCEAKQ